MPPPVDRIGRLPNLAARFVAACACAAVSACALVRLHQQTREFERSTVLVGRVEAGARARGSVVVGAYARESADSEAARWRLAHQTRLHEPGSYELIVPHGEYALFAFADDNGNGRPDPGEDAAAHADGRLVATQSMALVLGLDMTLGGAVSVPTPPVAAGPRGTQVGALLDLDAPEFASEQGRRGYWEPLDFFRELGGNVWFVTPFDPTKTPVLFVHGASGSPQDWRTLLARLDRRRFQPWLFFYPSGAPVESMSHLLFWKLLNLQLRWRCETVHVVAHSMGGLVVRRMLLDHGEQLPWVRHFVSISTPWAGEASADTGVEWSPAVVPSWRDMQPEGPFLRSLFAHRLPAHVDYHLLFGHRGSPGLWRPNNDGTITLASQLRNAAQQEARFVFGYDEDHVSILSSSQVAAQLDALLGVPRGAAAHTSLHVGLRAAHGGALLGLPLLVLRPSDGAPPVTVTLSAAAGGGRVGPLPPGRYAASVWAPGFGVTPRSADVELTDGGDVGVDFVLTPRGSLTGVVRGPEGPAGSFRSGPAPRLRCVTVRGDGIVRRLVASGELPTALAGLLADEDRAWSDGFAFLDLPAGDYEVVVEVESRAPLVVRHRVVPGDPGSVVTAMFGDR